MKYKISIEDEIENIVDMLKVDEYKEELNNYKRAINDIKISIESLIEDTEDHEDLYGELEEFIDVELNEILNGLNLD